MSNKRMINIRHGCIAAFLVLVIYITLHESGHAMVMMCVGATITEFSILTAQVRGAGGAWNDFTALWLHANGILLPGMAAALYALLYQKNKGAFYDVFSFIFTLAPVLSLLPWVILPFTFVQGITPVNDDVTKFLNQFAKGDSPWMVSAVASLLMAGLILLMVKKGILKNYISLIRQR